MESKRLFEYAVIRIVPRVEREEFMNVGVILYCAEANFLGVRIQVNIERLQAFAPKLSIAEVEASLQSLMRISQGDSSAGAIAQYNTAERFRWLTAQRSTIIQCSCVHPGLCADAATTLQHLFQQLVAE